MTTPGLRERFSNDERGFTLPEMLVTIVIMIFVFFALAGMFDMSLKVFSYANNKVEAVESARVAMEKMEREIRQAYAFNRGATPPDTHLFDTWNATQIRFGNDLNGNGVIECSSTPPPSCEKIGYQVSGNTLGRDNTSTGSTNTIGNLQPVADHVQSLTFTYFDRNGNVVNPGGTEATIDRVLVRLVISVNQGIGHSSTQTLTTVIDLRNR